MERPGTKVAQALYSADRHYLLVKLREITFGPELQGTYSCPTCRAAATVTDDLAALEVVRLSDGALPEDVTVDLEDQLGHAGRKASTTLPWEGDRPLTDDNAWEAISPSALPYDEGWPSPREMNRADMTALTHAFAAATTRALSAGFDLLEVHMAHGYLLSSFLTPLANHRSDAYGGSLENRMRYPLEVFGCDFIDVSSGQTSPLSRRVFGRMFQTPFADRIGAEADIRTIAVGNIQNFDQINTIVLSGRADLCALARPHLFDPYFTLHAAAAQGFANEVAWPKQYHAAKPIRPRFTRPRFTWWRCRPSSRCDSCHRRSTAAWSRCRS